MTAPARSRLRSFDWGPLLPLRIRAKAIADGVWLGTHRSLRRGSGVEFAGYREYTPGDDIRRLDRRALLLRDRLLVRQFEVETERECFILLDKSASMAYCGSSSSESKFDRARVLAAALARVIIRSGDPVHLFSFGGTDPLPVKRATGAAGFERVIAALESVAADGDSAGDSAELLQLLETVGRTARRGALIFLLSDLLDMSTRVKDSVRALLARGRTVVVIQVLDPDEATFPFAEPSRFRALEGEHVVDVVPAVARDAYLAALHSLIEGWRSVLTSGGGGLIPGTADESPVRIVVRAIQLSGRG